MTTDVDICNLALDEIGARVIITDLTENTPQGKIASRQYDPTRQQLLRAAPWGSARKTALLNNEGLLSANPPTSPFPWQAKNTYPADCLKMHYILPQPAPPQGSAPDVSSLTFSPWCAPSRTFRYIPAFDPGDSTTDPVTPPHKVLLTNITPCLGIYTVDLTDPDLFDVLFQNALVQALASRFVMGLTGNVGLKGTYAQLAQQAILEARAADGNEAIPTSDHTPDWIATRGINPISSAFGGSELLGLWYSGCDNMNWGM
jgi:hypothetical protein